MTGLTTNCGGVSVNAPAGKFSVILPSTSTVCACPAVRGLVRTGALSWGCQAGALGAAGASVGRISSLLSLPVPPAGWFPEACSTGASLPPGAALGLGVPALLRLQPSIATIIKIPHHTWNFRFEEIGFIFPSPARLDSFNWKVLVQLCTHYIKYWLGEKLQVACTFKVTITSWNSGFPPGCPGMGASPGRRGSPVS